MIISVKSHPKLKDILCYLACYPWVISWILTSTYFKDILHPYGIIRIWNIVGAVLIALRVLLIKRINQRRTIIAIMVILTGAIVSYNNDNAS
ncbi:MAG: hypothetical protein LIP11_10525, partial [Clostridiales bacterium]|nr:hypothetical protein [Clostridiales bacterium]